MFEKLHGIVITDLSMSYADIFLFLSISGCIIL